MTNPDKNPDHLEEAAKAEANRQRLAQENPEPSLGARFGQIGLLGWLVVIPALFGVWVGQLIDNALNTGIVFTACFLMLGVITGFWYIWRWMHKS